MTIPDLLKSCKGGKMPKVRFINHDKPIRSTTSNIGVITTIKDVPRKIKGCAVLFPGVYNDIWFYAENLKDERTRHMGELTLKID